MPVLGLQLCFSVGLISFLQKFNKYYSLNHHLLSNVKRYIFLSQDKEVSQYILKVNTNNNAKSDAIYSYNSLPYITSAFKFRNIQKNELETFAFYHNWEWLIDYCFISAVIVNLFYFALKLLLIYFVTSQENFLRETFYTFDLSLVWNTVIVIFAFYTLFKINYNIFAVNYHKKSSKPATNNLIRLSGESQLILLIFLISFMVSGLIYFAEINYDLKNIDILLSPTSPKTNSFSNSYYNDFDSYKIEANPNSYFTYLQNNRLETLYYVIMCLFGGFLGAFLFFPCFRLSTISYDALSYSTPLLKCLLALDAFGSIVLTLSWFCYDERAIWILYIRPLLHVAFGFLRFFMFRHHIQAYLRTAFDKVLALKPMILPKHEKDKNAPKVITASMINNTVNRIYAYVCCVNLQYVIPAIFYIFLSTILLAAQIQTLMPKNLSESTTSGDWSAILFKLVQNYTNIVPTNQKHSLLLSNETVYHYLVKPINFSLILIDVMTLFFTTFGYFYKRFMSMKL